MQSATLNIIYHNSNKSNQDNYIIKFKNASVLYYIIYYILPYNMLYIAILY